jgi:hypothetical protein
VFELAEKRDQLSIARTLLLPSRSRRLFLRFGLYPAPKGCRNYRLANVVSYFNSDSVQLRKAAAAAEALPLVADSYDLPVHDSRHHVADEHCGSFACCRLLRSAVHDLAIMLKPNIAALSAVAHSCDLCPSMISLSCCRRTMMLQTPAICPSMISPSRCRRALWPFRLLQTPAICPSMISPSCCHRTFRPFRLLQTPAICSSMISPSCCRRTLRSACCRLLRSAIHALAIMLPTNIAGADSCNLPVHDLAIMLPPSIAAIPPVRFVLTRVAFSYIPLSYPHLSLFLSRPRAGFPRLPARSTQRFKDHLLESRHIT